MPDRPYHHGNLKIEFIDRGLEYIDKYGVESLSMRKLAELIGVSHNAPYAHFKNKEAYLDAIHEHVTDSLTAVLKDSYENCEDKRRALIELGKSYVVFFYDNPLYYRFLFARGDMDIYSYPPFQFYSEVVDAVLRSMHRRLTEDEINRKMIAMWAMVHGLAQFAATRNVLGADSLEDKIEAILCSVDV